MTVTVRAHENIRPQLREFRRSLPGTREERAAAARACWEAFVADIVAANGRPPTGAVPDPRFPAAFWCPFPGGFLVLVHFPAPHRTGLFSRVIEAVAIELNLSPDRPG
ncbi:MAG: hypothetical protein K2V38_00450 [Gemmataceae bacterium]|nr:hypothetical protein [Gemmataceae bacterium]